MQNDIRQVWMDTYDLWGFINSLTGFIVFFTFYTCLFMGLTWLQWLMIVVGVLVWSQGGHRLNQPRMDYYYPCDD